MTIHRVGPNDVAWASRANESYLGWVQDLKASIPSSKSVAVGPMPVVEIDGATVDQDARAANDRFLPRVNPTALPSGVRMPTLAKLAPLGDRDPVADPVLPDRREVVEALEAAREAKGPGRAAELRAEIHRLGSAIAAAPRDYFIGWSGLVRQHVAHRARLAPSSLGSKSEMPFGGRHSMGRQGGPTEHRFGSHFARFAKCLGDHANVKTAWYALLGKRGPP